MLRKKVGQEWEILEGEHCSLCASPIRPASPFPGYCHARACLKRKCARRGSPAPEHVQHTTSAVCSTSRSAARCVLLRAHWCFCREIMSGRRPRGKFE